MPTHCHRFPAEMDSIDRAIQCVRDAGIAASLPDEQVRKLELVIEELFTNTATHAVRRNGEAIGSSIAATKLYVWIAANPTSKGLDVQYQDDGPAFDPTAIQADAAGEAVANARVGGIGRVLICSLPASVSYDRENGRNRVSLHFAR